MSEHPEVQWALDLLSPDPNRKTNPLREYSPELCGVTTGFLLCSLKNFVNRRPYYTGIQHHVITMVGGFFVSKFIKKLMEDYKADRDTQLRDYIIRHPELFPEPERHKFKDLLKPWIPIR